MGKASIAILLSFLVTGPVALASVTFVSAGGVSRYQETSDAEGTKTYTIYGGVAGSCGTTSTCDTCDGTGLTPCNERAIGTTTVVRLAGRTTSTGTSRKGALMVGTGSGGNLVYGTVVDGSGNFSVEASWGDLCGQMSSSSCGTDAAQSFRFGVIESNGTDFVSGESIPLRFVVSNANARAKYTRCDNQPSGTNDGFCSFSVWKGDGKLYVDGQNADSLTTSADFPAAGSVSEVKWDKLVFFFAERSGTAVSTIQSIRNNFSKAELPFTAVDDRPENVDPRVTGLENGVEYCMVMANQDTAGNIAKFSDTADSQYSNESFASTKMCGTPEEVVGLLDDKKCFIATAAWGSPLDPHVKTLRSFRDRFLKTNPWGSAFVEAYYEWSPPWAKWISQHEGIRALVRGALWPLLAFAWLSLEIGLFATLGLGAVLLSTSGYFVYRAQARRRMKA